MRIYDCSVKTGSDALDLILTQKSIICENYNIKLSCIIDGANLGFMRGSDILALFGNALDNAIEEVQKEVSPEKRIISLRVSCEMNMLFIHMDNYCSSSLIFNEGFPLTTKADKNYHGFGVKSIRYIVKKYNGDVNMYLQDGKFNLDILFALRKNSE